MDFEPLRQISIHPDMALVVRHLQAIASGNDLPKWLDFRPSQVRHALGYVFLIDVLPDQNDFRYHLLGEHILILYGLQATNKLLSELGYEAQFARLRDTYHAVVKARSFLYLRGRYDWPDRSVAIERLLVPMADGDGHLNFILGLTIPDAPTDQISVFAGLGPALLEIDEQITGKAAN